MDVPVKVIIQNRATWTSTFYVGRLTLEDSKDVRRRYRLQDWLDAMKVEDRDAVMSMLRWDTNVADVEVGVVDVTANGIPTKSP